MHIAYHIGAHCTDDERLLKSLLRNRDWLGEYDVAVPGPGKYRSILGDVMTKLRGEIASRDTQDVVLEAMLEGDDPARVVLSNASFISVPARVIEDSKLYARAFKAGWMRNVFPDHEVSFFMAMRNPASFVPALHAALGADRPGFADFLAGTDPRALRWSDTVTELRRAAPDSAITVWCNEDTPLIWDEIIRAVAGLAAEAHLHGGLDMLRTIISNEGMRRLRAYLRNHPPATPALRRRIVSAFLDKFAIEDELEDELDLPGWTEELVDALSRSYDEDVARIAAMPGVTLIAP